MAETVPTSQTILDGMKIGFNSIVRGEASSYSILGRTFSSHNVRELSDLIQEWEGIVAEEAAGGRKIYGVGRFREAL